MARVDVMKRRIIYKVYKHGKGTMIPSAGILGDKYEKNVEVTDYGIEFVVKEICFDDIKDNNTSNDFFIKIAEAEAREAWVGVMGIVASLLCVVALLSAWILLPRWRTLQAYICINEVIFGTVALCFYPGVFLDDLGEMLYQRGKITEESLCLWRLWIDMPYFSCLAISFCWSVCASIVAYVRLVKLQPRISYEKTIATAASFGLFGILLVASIEILQLVIRFDILNSPYYSVGPVLVLMLLGVFSINIVLFIIICAKVMSCCRVGMSERGSSHVIALVGVAVLCQATAAFEHTTRIVISYYFKYDSYGEYIWLVSSIVFNLRLVPLTVVILCNKPTRLLWKAFVLKFRRRNAVVNTMPLRPRQI